MYKYHNLSKLNGIGLQFFAESGGDDGGDGGGVGHQGAGDDQGGEHDDGDEGTGGSDKTFTQADVNKLMAKEKRKGRMAVLKELGLDPEDKEAVGKLKKLLEDNQSDGEKKDKALKDAQESATKETDRANKAERKLKVLMAGCHKDFVEEVTAMALAKVDEDTDFDEALEAVKKKMPTCFGSEGAGDDTGTGRGQGHKKQKSGEKPGSFGARLAQSASTQKTNPYFQN